MCYPGTSWHIFARACRKITPEINPQGCGMWRDKNDLRLQEKKRKNRKEKHEGKNFIIFTCLQNL